MNLESLMEQHDMSFGATRLPFLNVSKEPEEVRMMAYFQSFFHYYYNHELNLLDIVKLVQVLRYEKNKEAVERFLRVFSMTRSLARFTREDGGLSVFKNESAVVLSELLQEELNKKDNDPSVQMENFRELCKARLNDLSEQFVTRNHLFEEIQKSFVELIELSVRYPEFYPLNAAENQIFIDTLAIKVVQILLDPKVHSGPKKEKLIGLLMIDQIVPFNEKALPDLNKNVLYDFADFLFWVNSVCYRKVKTKELAANSTKIEIHRAVIDKLPNNVKDKILSDVQDSVSVGQGSYFTKVLLEYVVTGNEKSLVRLIEVLLSESSSTSDDRAKSLTGFLFDIERNNAARFCKMKRSTWQEITALTTLKDTTNAGGASAMLVVRHWLQQAVIVDDTDVQQKTPNENGLEERVKILEEIVKNQNRILQSMRRKRRR